MNSIFARKHASSDDVNISEEAVIKGVAVVEEKIVSETFVAYRPIYPKAREVCSQCIPELKHKFSIGDLERVFRTHGKRALESDDFHEFKRLFIQIGAVGRVISETDWYIQGHFEYTVPHQFATGTDDMLCVHPLFAKIFSAKILEKKPVYPYGTNVEDGDFRDLY